MTMTDERVFKVGDEVSIEDIFDLMDIYRNEITETVDSTHEYVHLLQNYNKKLMFRIVALPEVDKN